MIPINGNGSGGPQQKQAVIGRGQKGQRVHGQTGAFKIEQDGNNIHPHVDGDHIVDKLPGITKSPGPGVVLIPRSGPPDATVRAFSLGRADEFSAVGAEN
jgi:hypothetical protein